MTTEDINKSDFIIINTCGFIKPAKEESIKVILDVCELKKQKKRINLYAVELKNLKKRSKKSAIK